MGRIDVAWFCHRCEEWLGDHECDDVSHRSCAAGDIHWARPLPVALEWTDAGEDATLCRECWLLIMTAGR